MVAASNNSMNIRQQDQLVNKYTGYRFGNLLSLTIIHSDQFEVSVTQLQFTQNKCFLDNSFCYTFNLN